MVGNLRLARPAHQKLILAVDDDPDCLAISTATLEHQGFLVEKASSAEEALEKLKKFTPDLMLLDINMPGMSGLDAIAQIRKRDQYFSVIFVSARNQTDDIVRGLDAGADDYICKPYDPVELLARVKAHLRIKDLTEKLEVANRRLQQLVDIDDLTGLYNMRSVYQKLENEIARARRFGRAVGVVMMDMDNFKNVNDTNDHLFGSFVLSEVGKLISDNIRQVDFGARYGGDEFLIALSETTIEGAALFCERLRAVIEGYRFKSPTSAMNLTASIGLAVIEPATHPNIDAKSLVRAADNALYKAKRNGKNCVKVFDMASLVMRKTS
ncbi:MAG TPA: diguanylate cyclase [Bdellovibrionales bacterium]|jgi:diguanylate cyclase (GGDEF)-like protein|nr:diguanylate cyclase [Bdellovibrionales bacterium]